jgi:hypothetical protein
MLELTSDGNPCLAEAGSMFALTVNGPDARSEIVQGLEGVRDRVLAVVLRERNDANAHDLAMHIARLEDPAVWAEHGVGDGRPYWHWWLGLQNGSISVQRITEPLPADPELVAGEADRGARLARAAEQLKECGAELRRVMARQGLLLE